MTGRKTSRNFKPRRITERDTTSTPNDNPRLPRKIGIATKIGIAKTLGLPEEQPEVSETPNIRLELPKPRTKPPKLIPTILARKHEDYYKDD